MKKINILLTAVLVASTTSAQQKVADFPGEESLVIQEIYNRLTPQRSILERGKRAPQVTQDATLEIDTVSDPNFIGYSNPRGTFFLGLDEAGTGNWLTDIQEYFSKKEYTKPVYGVSANGVIGAWSDSIPCWVWPYQGGDAKKVQYQTMLSENHPKYVEDEFYATDAKGNFHDSIVSAGGWSEAFMMGLDGGAYYEQKVQGLSEPCKFVEGMWQPAVPMQYVTMNDGTVKRYQMLRSSKYWDETDAFGIKDYPLAIGGLPNAQTEDGLWPLTQAEPINTNGTSFVLGVGSGERNRPYYFGSYADSVPQQIIVDYDAPQAPLYIERISLAVGAQKYTNKYTKDSLRIDQLHLTIQDKDGRILAQADANGASMTNASYPTSNRTRLLTFQIGNQTSSYGEILSKGILVKGEFRIIITGFKSTDDFGIYAAKTVHHESKASVVYKSGVVKSNYEPYIMLHGIMPTWEPYANYAAAEQYGYKTGVHGDTIDINFVSAQSPYYQYIAHYAGSDYADGNEFDFYSSFLPYDSVTRMWNLDIQMPEYVTIGAGYENEFSIGGEKVLLWDYLRLFWMKIYATDMPTVGDYITIGKCGRYTYFHIVSVDGGKTIEEILANQNRQHQSILKTLDSKGQIRILKDGNQYNVLGTKLL